MKDFVYILRVLKSGQPASIQTGRVHCEHFRQAVEMALDTESMPWEEKRAYREIISITEAIA